MSYTQNLVRIVPVMIFMFTSTISCLDSIQRDFSNNPSSIGLRSALLNDNDAAAAAALKSVPSAEMDSYQGLVGRPGIDFPVLTQIPRTVFDCKSHGNGYFADLETRCQVFHICDEGKKISFLCPNGTIFRQLDLICDWWFKVDCAATPNHFAESTEMLSQAKRARLQSKHPVPQPINPNDKRLTSSIQDKRLLLGNTNNLQPFAPLGTMHKIVQFNKRLDRSNPVEQPNSNAPTSASESSKSKKGNDRKITFDNDEIQDTAQSASFASLSNKMFNTYYTQEQLAKDVLSFSKPRRPEANENNVHRDHPSVLPFPRDAQTKRNNNKSDVNYAPYTTARKLNLSGKITQFYTPTVPTFTASTRTATEGEVTGTWTDTTKATTVKSDASTNGAAVVQSHSFPNQFDQPIRRESFADDESVMDHAMEIMETIKSLNIDERDNNENSDKAAILDVEARISSRIYGEDTKTSPSLISVALPATPSLDFWLQPAGGRGNTDSYKLMRHTAGRSSNHHVGHGSLLTRSTLNEYDRLFHLRNNENDANRIDDEHKEDGSTEKNQYYIDTKLENDLEGQSSRYPVFGISNTTQIRELAQIFTHALSAYLQDPITFRRILTEIRPKTPASQLANQSQSAPETKSTGASPSSETTTYLPSESSAYYAPLRSSEKLEVLDFSDITTTTSDSIPTDSETTVLITSTMPTTISNDNESNSSTGNGSTGVKQGKSLSIQFATNSRNELADEVNGELGTSSFDGGYTDHASLEVKGSDNGTPLQNVRPRTNVLVVSSSRPANVVTEPIPAPQSVLKPPVHHQGSKATNVLEEDEQLQHAQSESILASHSKPIYERSKYSVISLHNFKDSSNNDETVRTISTVQTPSTTIDPLGNVKPVGAIGANPSRTTMSYTVFFDPLTINDELMELEKPKPTIAHTTIEHEQRRFGWNGTLLKAESTPSENVKVDPSVRLTEPETHQEADGMQKKANEMFGELNEGQANKLMTAMKLADKNKSMRRLILLLIRTCDDDSATANEESRKALLEALINIGGVVENSNANELHSSSEGEARPYDQSYRQGKEIGSTNVANVLYDGPATLNITATTENYANVGKFSPEGSDDKTSDEKMDHNEDTSSEEWSNGNGSDLQTTVATTKLYYSSVEDQTKYQPGNFNTRGKWVHGSNDEGQQTQSTTTPLPTTLFRTTTDNVPSFYTTAEPTATTTTVVSTLDGLDITSTTISTTNSNVDTKYRSIESFESDSPTKQQPILPSQRIPKDLTSSLAYPGADSDKHGSPHNSDTRALELLKSLYSLAARWG